MIEVLDSLNRWYSFILRSFTWCSHSMDYPGRHCSPPTLLYSILLFRVKRQPFHVFHILDILCASLGSIAKRNMAWSYFRIMDWRIEERGYLWRTPLWPSSSFYIHFNQFIALITVPFVFFLSFSRFWYQQYSIQAWHK